MEFVVNPNICRVPCEQFLQDLLRKVDLYLRSQMEVVERDEVSLEESREKAEVNPVSKLTVQIIHLQVDLEEFCLILNISTLFPVWAGAQCSPYQDERDTES